MSIKTLSKKMLAIVAAGAMTMGLAMPTSVFAANGDPETSNTEAYISKTYNTQVAKAETFSFTATQVTQNTGETDLVTTTHGITMPTISFTDETESATKVGKIDFGTFEKAGQYEYTVTETQQANPEVANGEHQKLIMSKAEYKMDVYVTDTEQND